jgi:hypothetical protein
VAALAAAPQAEAFFVTVKEACLQAARDVFVIAATTLDLHLVK